jgi:STE24 endopeptidase
MSHTLFWIIVILIVVDFLFSKSLSLLNLKRMTTALPEELKGIYNQEKYTNSLAYQKTNIRFSFISDSFSLVVFLVVLFLGGFARIDDWARTITDNAYLQSLLFFGILGFAMDLISMPFQLYDTFVIEERFGFNKTTIKTFILDKLKGWLVSGLLGALILLFIQWAFMATGDWFWFIVMGGLSFFMIFMAMFYTQIFVPIFNKLTPLEEGDLKSAIEQFAQKAGFKLDNIYVIDGSKRSTKANAYFSGLGTKKRIILYDTLINDLTTEEIVAVLAHEVGHNKNKHIVKGLVMSLVQTGILVALLWYALSNPELSYALGAKQPSFHMGLLAFAFLFSPVSFIVGILSNLLSRKFEYQADAYAGNNYNAGMLVSALIKLSVKSLSNLRPHPLYVFFNYSHPTLLQRMSRLKAKSKAA